MNQELERNTILYNSVRDILKDARFKAYTRVNSVMVEAYWRIGQRIVEEEQQGQAKAGYGEALLQGLSRALTDEFGKGFSYSNLRNFRQFYQVWPDFEKCYTLCSKLSWSHNRLIMRVESEEELTRELNARHVLEIENEGGGG